MATKIKDLRLNDDVELAVDTVTWADVLDEDSMDADSAAAVPTQQSTKAYADTKLAKAGGTMTGDITMTDGEHIILGTSGGNNIGTATNQKLGFYGVTPIVQPVNTVTLDTLLANLGLRASGGTSNFGTAISVPSYERHIQIDAKSDGTVANQPLQVDFFTAGGLQFNQTNVRYAYCQWEVPDDWDGTDAYIEIDWFPDSGAMSGADAVRWTIEYRTVAEGELINNGTSVTLDNSAAGDTSDHAQYKTIHTRFTIPASTGDQRLSKQDHVYFKVSRDVGVSGDFNGTVTVTAYEIIYNSVGLPTSN